MTPGPDQSNELSAIDSANGSLSHNFFQHILKGWFYN